MGKRKYVLLAVFLLLLAAAGAAFYFYPVWKAAGAMQEKMGSEGLVFRMEVELDQGRQPPEGRRMYKVLAALTGIEEETMYRLTVEGSVWKDKAHMLVYPEGMREPLAEFYLSEGMSAINETMLYDSIRSHLAGQYALLEYLMPRQKETLYMTFDQVEQVLGVDLSDIRGIGLPVAERGITTGECFLLLAAMDRQEKGLFALETEQMELSVEIGRDSQDSRVEIYFRTENPAEVFAAGEDLLTRKGIRLPETDLSSVKSLSISIVPGEGAPIEMPSDFVNQVIIDIISKIRTWLGEAFGADSSENML